MINDITIFQYCIQSMRGFDLMDIARLFISFHGYLY